MPASRASPVLLLLLSDRMFATGAGAATWPAPRHSLCAPTAISP